MFETSPAGAQRKTARLEAGQQVEGTVLAISGGLVIVDIGSSADASLDLTEFNDRAIKVGDRVRATVATPRAEGPLLTLSLGRGGTSVNTATLELALSGGTPVSGTVSASNKGGFTVDIAGTRAFCPISQIDLSYVRDPEVYVGQTLDFQVMEIKEGGRNIVVSRRKLLQDERRQAESELMSNLAPGAIVSGTIKSTVRSGAIVDLGGIEAFIPISELARARVELAEDVVSIGETVQAQVLSVEQNDKGLSIRLSLKALSAPIAERQVEKDEILVGKVIKHVPAGVIVSTEKGEGLVPTRELSLPPGADHRRTYALDTELRVVVVSRDPTSGKLRFSVGRVAEVEERNNFREFGKPDNSKPSGSMGSLGELMSKKFPKLAAQAKAQAVPEPPASPPAAPKKTAPKEQQASPPQAEQKSHDGVRRRKK